MKRLTKQRLDNMDVNIQQVVAARVAIEDAFVWDESLQGFKFWNLVHDNLLDIEVAFEEELK